MKLVPTPEPLMARVLRPIANWLSSFSPQLRQSLDEYDKAVSYSHDVDSVYYLSIRGLLTPKQTIDILEAIDRKQTGAQS